MIEEQRERQRKQEATQPDSVTAENYAHVVAEVMRRDGIELNGQDCMVIRTRVLDMLTARRQREQRQNAARISGRSRSGYGDNWLILLQSAKLHYGLTR
ncbi:hypothetical protein A8535_001238 [Escherichia coli]|nr:hypothetical protein [Escherichia coli]